MTIQPVIAPSSLPRSAPVLRWSAQLPKVDQIPMLYTSIGPWSLTPAVRDGHLTVRGRMEDAWTSFDLADGSVVARGALPGKVALCSAPAIASDGRVAVLAFESLEKGFVLHEYSADGTLVWSFRPTIPYALTEGPTPADMGIPDYLPGPGVVLAPHPAVDRTWILCAEESGDNQAQWKTIAVRSGGTEPLWSRGDRFWGGTELAGIMPDEHGFAGVDLRTGKTIWKPGDLSRYSGETHVNGSLAMFSRREEHRVSLVAHDVESGKRHFVKRTRSGYRDTSWPCDGRVLYQEEDGTVDIIALDGSVLASGTTPRRVFAFDGVSMLAASKEILACGPASEPGAWAWTMPSPTAIPLDLGVAAQDGWLVLCDRRTGALLVYGPQ